MKLNLELIKKIIYKTLFIKILNTIITLAGYRYLYELFEMTLIKRNKKNQYSLYFREKY
jgi:hypothetical protein